MGGVHVFEFDAGSEARSFAGVVQTCQQHMSMPPGASGSPWMGEED